MFFVVIFYQANNGFIAGATLLHRAFKIVFNTIGVAAESKSYNLKNSALKLCNT